MLSIERWVLKKLALSGCLLIYLATSSGCNLCCPPYQDDYATLGGRWPRANPTEGRVGSAFSDPEIAPVAPLTSYNAARAARGIGGLATQFSPMTTPAETAPILESSPIRDGQPAPRDETIELGSQETLSGPGIIPSETIRLDENW